MSEQTLVSMNELETVKKASDDSFIIYKINPDVYSIDVVKNACYLLMNKALFFLDINENNDTLVEIRPNNKNQTLDDLLKLFNTNLIDFARYKQESEDKKDLREALLKAALK
jgi:His-Xaa-Ser system protein HxsD